MKTPVLSQTERSEDGAFQFAVPALLLAAVLAMGALTLVLGAMSAEPLLAASAPASEPLTTFVGA